jgi:hypothetical protein
MLKLETQADLEALHTGNIKESISLEYKASPAIDKKDDNKKTEMARDVSAFANADGGQIVYGMTEKDHEPAGLDNGVDGNAYPEIWFEQVLQQHITPPIPGLRIRHIPLTKPMVAVVIEVPATKADPHQVSDGRYYRRHNFNRLTMEHYEVRDSMRRAVDPALILDFDLFHGDAAYKNVEFNQYRDQSDPIALGAVVKNNSNQPSMYTVVSIFIDRRVKIVKPESFEISNLQKFSETDIRHHLRHSMGIPGGYSLSCAPEFFDLCVGQHSLARHFRSNQPRRTDPVCGRRFNQPVLDSPIEKGTNVAEDSSCVARRRPGDDLIN